VICEEAREDVVGAPPEEEEGAEKEGRCEAVVDAVNAVDAVLRHAQLARKSYNRLLALQSSRSSRWAHGKASWIYQLRTGLGDAL